jgi:hypothetical protein
MPISMPDVDAERDFSTVLAEARKGAPGPDHSAGQRHISIITPGRLIMMLPCPPAGSVSPEMVEGIRRIVPDAQPQAISAIAFTDVVRHGALDAARVNELIPFTGYLLGMAFVGHNVVVFEGHPSALSAGCLGADLLIVDGAMVDHLQEDWVAVAVRVMRQPRILVFGRDGRIVAIDPSMERWKKSEEEPSKKRRWWPF